MENLDEKIEDYLHGDLPEAEMLAFASAMEKDAALVKAVLEHQQMLERLEALRLRKKVKTALEQPDGTGTKEIPFASNRLLWIIATSTVLLFSALWFFNQKPDPPKNDPKEQQIKPKENHVIPSSAPKVDMAQNEPTTQKPKERATTKPVSNNGHLLALANEFHRTSYSSIVRDALGNNDAKSPKTALQLAAAAFDKGDFALAAQILQSDGTVEQDEIARFLRAEARFQSNQFKGAALDFDALNQSFRFKHDARWNYLLCQLAQGKMKRTNALLSTMLTDTDFPFYEQALALKGRL